MPYPANATNREGMTWEQWSAAADVYNPVVSPIAREDAWRDFMMGVDPTEWRARIQQSQPRPAFGYEALLGRTASAALDVAASWGGDRRLKRAALDAVIGAGVARALDAAAFARTAAPHPGVSAVMLVQRAISQLVIPEPRLTYAGMRRVSGEGAHGIHEGSIDVLLSMRTRSGVSHAVTIPVLVRNSQLLPPSILIDNGATRLIAQPVIDEIAGRATYPSRGPARQMFQVPGGSGGFFTGW